MRVFYLYK